METSCDQLSIIKFMVSFVRPLANGTLAIFGRHAIDKKSAKFLCWPTVMYSSLHQGILAQKSLITKVRSIKHHNPMPFGRASQSSPDKKIYHHYRALRRGKNRASSCTKVKYIVYKMEGWRCSWRRNIWSDFPHLGLISYQAYWQ